MESVTEICNLALTHIGQGAGISDIETEQSDAADACRTVFKIARNVTLRQFKWPFANQPGVALGLVETAPNDEWAYSYRYPSDAEKVLRIWSGIRNDTRQSRAPYKIVNNSDGKLIYTDVVNAVMEYTVRVDDVSLWPSDFCMALSYKIAYLIAPRLTGGDPFKLGQNAFQMFNTEITNAKAAALNEEQAEEDPDSEFIRTRE